MGSSSRTIGYQKGKPLHVVICDDSKLIFSDDYRAGWKEGFEGIGCRVTMVDISPMRSFVKLGNRESVLSMRSPMPKLLAQNVKSMKPDLVFCHHGRAASSDLFTGTLSSASIRTVVYLCDEPYECGETALYSPKFGYVFTMDPSTMELHRRARADSRQVFYLPPAANVSHFHEKPYKDRNGPSAFFLGNGTLTPRTKYLEAVDRMVDGSVINYMKTTVKQHRDWIPYDKHPHYYANCLVGLNVHRSPWIDRQCWEKRVKSRPANFPVVNGMSLPNSPPQEFGTGFWNDYNLDAHHWNPRFLEMAACGTLVVNDDSRTELAREFPYVPRAKDPAHFLDLVLHYVRHKDEAEEIGRICRHQIFRRHTYQHRAAEILIRVGLKDWLRDERCSFLGGPEDWLTPQDFEQLTATSSSEQIGRSERWNPQSGRLLTKGSGSPKGITSTDAVLPW